jgi:hypothetical protein
MTFLALQEELGRRLVELKGAEGMWDPTERQLALNLSQLDMARELRLIRAVAVRDALANTQDYSITAAVGSGGFGLSNFLGILGEDELPGLIYDDGTQETVLRFRTVEWLYATHPNWRRDASGVPEVFFPSEGGEVFNDKIGVYPKPASTVTNGFRLHHLVRPADMTADGHQPFNVTAGTTVQFPSLEPYHDALVWRALWRLLQDDSPQLADRAWQYYLFVIRKAKGHAFLGVHTDDRQVQAVSAYGRRSGRRGAW